MICDGYIRLPYSFPPSNAWFIEEDTAMRNVGMPTIYYYYYMLTFDGHVLLACSMHMNEGRLKRSTK